MLWNCFLPLLLFSTSLLIILVTSPIHYLVDAQQIRNISVTMTAPSGLRSDTYPRRIISTIDLYFKPGSVVEDDVSDVYSMSASSSQCLFTIERWSSLTGTSYDNNTGILTGISLATSMKTPVGGNCNEIQAFEVFTKLVFTVNSVSSPSSKFLYASGCVSYQKVEASVDTTARLRIIAWLLCLINNQGYLATMETQNDIDIVKNVLVADAGAETNFWIGATAVDQRPTDSSDDPALTFCWANHPDFADGKCNAGNNYFSYMLVYTNLSTTCLQVQSCPTTHTNWVDHEDAGDYGHTHGLILNWDSGSETYNFSQECTTITHWTAHPHICLTFVDYVNNSYCEGFNSSFVSVTNSASKSETITLSAASPTSTGTVSETLTKTASPSATFTESSTETRSDTSTESSSPSTTETSTETASPSLSATSSKTQTGTASTTATSTETANESISESVSSSESRSETPTSTLTTSSTETSTKTASPSLSVTSSGTQTDTLSTTATSTFTETSTETSSDTWTESSSPSTSESSTKTGSPSLSVTSSVTQTDTRSTTATSTFTETSTETRSDSSTESSSPTSTETSTETTSASLSATSSKTQTGTVSATATSTETASKSITETISPSESHSESSTSTLTTSSTLSESVSKSTSLSATSSETSSKSASPSTTSTETFSESFSETRSGPTKSRTSSETSTGSISSSKTRSGTKPSPSSTESITETLSFSGSLSTSHSKTIPIQSAEGLRLPILTGVFVGTNFILMVTAAALPPLSTLLQSLAAVSSVGCASADMKASEISRLLVPFYVPTDSPLSGLMGIVLLLVIFVVIHLIALLVAYFVNENNFELASWKVRFPNYSLTACLIADCGLAFQAGFLVAYPEASGAEIAVGIIVLIFLIVFLVGFYFAATTAHRKYLGKSNDVLFREREVLWMRSIYPGKMRKYLTQGLYEGVHSQRWNPIFDVCVPSYMKTMNLMHPVFGVVICFFAGLTYANESACARISYVLFVLFILFCIFVIVYRPYRRPLNIVATVVISLFSAFVALANAGLINPDVELLVTGVVWIWVFVFITCASFILEHTNWQPFFVALIPRRSRPRPVFEDLPKFEKSVNPLDFEADESDEYTDEEQQHSDDDDNNDVDEQERNEVVQNMNLNDNNNTASTTAIFINNNLLLSSESETPHIQERKEEEEEKQVVEDVTTKQKAESKAKKWRFSKKHSNSAQIPRPSPPSSPTITITAAAAAATTSKQQQQQQLEEGEEEEKRNETSSSSSMVDLAGERKKLNTQLNKWKRNFVVKNYRDPIIDDIVADAEIAHVYKTYTKLKEQQQKQNQEQNQEQKQQRPRNLFIDCTVPNITPSTTPTVTPRKFLTLSSSYY